MFAGTSLRSGGKNLKKSGAYPPAFGDAMAKHYAESVALKNSAVTININRYIYISNVNRKISVDGCV